MNRKLAMQEAITMAFLANRLAINWFCRPFELFNIPCQAWVSPYTFTLMTDRQKDLPNAGQKTMLNN